MPLLAVDTTASVGPERKAAFTDAVTECYVDEMDTTAGHVAVVVRERDAAEMSLGRADSDRGPLWFLDADVRAGRSFERKRSFALAVIDLAVEHFDAPREHAKVVFTEHEGNQMMGYDRVGADWDDGE